MEKEKIAQKLWNNEELSNDEIIFICRNLREVGVNSIPFDHTATSTLKACGILDEDVDIVNKSFKEMMLNGGEERTGKISQLCEMIENMAMTNPKALRLIIYQTVKISMENHVKQASRRFDSGETGSSSEQFDKLLRKLLGRNPKDDDNDK